MISSQLLSTSLTFSANINSPFAISKSLAPAVFIPLVFLSLLKLLSTLYLLILAEVI